MRTVRMPTILLAGLMAAVFSARQPTPPQILFLGQFHGEEVRAKSGEEWIALVLSETGRSELAVVSLRVDAVADEIAGDKGGQKTGKRTSLVGVPGKVAFLLKGVPGVQAGPAETVSTGEVLGPNRPVKLSLASGAGYDLVLSCPSPETKADVERSAGRLILTDGTTSQVLDTPSVVFNAGSYDGVGSGAQPKIIWAGDIDRDGKLDLLLDLSDHYNVFKPTLFLSGTSRKGVLVRKMAELVTVGC